MLCFELNHCVNSTYKDSKQDVKRGHILMAYSFQYGRWLLLVYYWMQNDNWITTKMER